jgi:hypothetical protein
MPHFSSSHLSQVHADYRWLLDKGELQMAVAEVFGDKVSFITPPLPPEGYAAVRARVPGATDAEIDSVYWSLPF